MSEEAWPAEVFGLHNRFSIMNYGQLSMLTADDKSDLQRLYQLAWTGQLTHINGTPIRLLRPFHTTGSRDGLVALSQLAPELASVPSVSPPTTHYQFAASVT